MNCWSAKPSAIALCIACCGLTLAACAPDLGPQPLIATATQFQTAKSLPPGNQPWPADTWWRAFSDPQLDQLIYEAVANSPTMSEAVARVELAKAQAINAQAALLPNIGAMGTVRDSRITQNLGLPSDGDFHWLGAALVTGSFEIDFWGKNRAGLEAATSQAMATKADAAGAQLILASQVASAYVDFARLQVMRDLAASAVRMRKETRDLAALRLQTGTGQRQAVDQADSAVDAATAQLRSVDESIVLTRHMIAALLGAGPDRGDGLKRPTLIRRRNPGLPTNLPLELVGRKPELVAARWRAEAAAQRIHQATAAYYPNVNLMAVAGVVSMGLDKLFQDRSVLVSAGPAISLPIFDGGRLEAGYRGARAEYDLAVASYRDVLLQSLHAAADAVASLKALRGRSAAANAAEAKAQNAYDLTKLRYKGGLADYDSVLLTENALITAREEAASLRLRGYQLDIALARALGGGFRGTIPTERTQ
ncbi:efflux transporter outer membrane subunit [Roseixanthobacter glucoisosaccharinicivorans]|uniref:efflux transporter outer membrane subunit n=1 Tax=Roseixanthobacter glucoisosaccharinicivorans TaxID=3119923 RepID=UPI003728FA32